MYMYRNMDIYGGTQVYVYIHMSHVHIHIRIHIHIHVHIHMHMHSTNKEKTQPQRHIDTKTHLLGKTLSEPHVYSNYVCVCPCIDHSVHLYVCRWASFRTLRIRWQGGTADGSGAQDPN